MFTAYKAITTFQTMYAPTKMSVKQALAPKTNLFQKSAVLNSVEDDAFAFAMIDSN